MVKMWNHLVRLCKDKDKEDQKTINILIFNLNYDKVAW